MKGWKIVETIFLMDNKFSRLHEKPSCPKLVTLFLQNNINLRSIPDSFFENMPLLQVLDLSQSGIKPSPPSSLFKLRKLKKLILWDCHFWLSSHRKLVVLNSLRYLISKVQRSVSFQMRWGNCLFSETCKYPFMDLLSTVIICQVKCYHLRPYQGFWRWKDLELVCVQGIQGGIKA